MNVRSDKKKSSMRQPPLTFGIILLLLFFATSACDGAGSHDDSEVQGDQSEVPAMEEIPPPVQSAPAQYPQFPLPPPRASALSTISSNPLKNPQGEFTSLGDVEQKLSAALEVGGYDEKSYFAVPNGFALVTRMEQINPDGTSRPSPNRWVVGAEPLNSFSLREYLRALLTANSGYYRIIAFIVTPNPFPQSDTAPSESEATAWLHQGLNALPSPIAAIEFTEQHKVTALIYEFERNRSEEVTTRLPSRLTGRIHLEKSGILGNLVK